MLKFFPIFPNDHYHSDKRVILMRKWLSKDLKNKQQVTKKVEEADIFLVMSGDGGLASVISNYHHYNKPFFGVNCGNLGFLLNEINNISQIPESFEDINIIPTKLIRTEFINHSDELKEFFAFNDVFCGGSVADFTTFEIIGSMNHFQNLRIKGNGIFISSTQGTTAYALNTKGSSAVLPLDSDTWYIGGIATGPYPSAIVKPQDITINVKSRGEISAYADGKRQMMSDIKKIHVYPTDKIVKISFLKKIDFESRRKSLALSISQGIFIDRASELE